MSDDRQHTPTATEAFAVELGSLVDRFCQNWDITYAEVVGTLTLQAQKVGYEGMMAELDASFEDLDEGGEFDA